MRLMSEGGLCGGGAMWRLGYVEVHGDVWR